MSVDNRGGITITSEEFFAMFRNMELKLEKGLAEIKTEISHLKEDQKAMTAIDERARMALKKAEKHEEDIKEIKDNQTWLWRWLIGTAVTTALSLLSLILSLTIKYLGG
jgi:anti-sigma-K factor RskA